MQCNFYIYAMQFKCKIVNVNVLSVSIRTLLTEYSNFSYSNLSVTHYFVYEHGVDLFKSLIQLKNFCRHIHIFLHKIIMRCRSIPGTTMRKPSWCGSTKKTTLVWSPWRRGAIWRGSLSFSAGVSKRWGHACVLCSMWLSVTVKTAQASIICPAEMLQLCLLQLNAMPFCGHTVVNTSSYQMGICV